MRKFFILIVIISLTFSFCTSDNPTQVTSNGDYTDSIIVDLYSYSMWFLQKNVNYYGTLDISEREESVKNTT